jgi:hypothetical protein
MVRRCCSVGVHSHRLSQANFRLEKRFQQWSGYVQERSTREQLAHRFAYAISLLRGAERIAEKGDPVDIAALPVFLLLGFALENAFASFLIANDHKNHADYKTHDLALAMKAAKTYNLVLSAQASEFIEKQAPLQKSFVFRYPEKMEGASLPPVKDACKLVRSILTDVDTVLRIHGIKLDEIAEQL